MDHKQAGQVANQFLDAAKEEIADIVQDQLVGFLMDLEPSDVFSNADLDEWATNNGYVQGEED